MIQLVVAALVGCTTTEQETRPGALPRNDTPHEARLNASTHMASGELLERQGQFRSAAAQYLKALELNPQLTVAHNRLGVTLNKLGDHKDASQQFRLALQQEPHSAALHNNLGFSLYLDGQLEAAEVELAQALELQPDFRRARMNHALVLGKLGRYDEALAAFALAGSQEDAYYNVAVLQTDAGLFADAARTLEKALAVNPQFAAAREQLQQITRQAAAQEAALAAQEPVVADTTSTTTPTPTDDTSSRAANSAVRKPATGDAPGDPCYTGTKKPTHPYRTVGSIEPIPTPAATPNTQPQRQSKPKSQGPISATMTSEQIIATLDLWAEGLASYDYAILAAEPTWVTPLEQFVADWSAGLTWDADRNTVQWAGNPFADWN